MSPKVLWNNAADCLHDGNGVSAPGCPEGCPLVSTSGGQEIHFGRSSTPRVLLETGPDEQAALGARTTTLRTLYDALEAPRTLDELERATGLSPGALRSDVTLLELRRVVVRHGDQLQRRHQPAG